MTTIRQRRPPLGDGERARAPDALNRQIGIAMVVLAGVFWSLQGPAVRMIETASGPQIIFWRSIGQLAVMMCVVAIVNRGRVLSAFRLAGYRAVVGALCHAAAGTCFVLAVLHTTVANVVFTMASAPLIAAAGAWLLLRERIERRTLGAMVAAVFGIAVMMSEGLTTGSVAGTLLALVTTFGFAGIAVVARWGGGLNMLPAVCLGAAFHHRRRLDDGRWRRGGDGVRPALRARLRGPAHRGRCDPVPSMARSSSRPAYSYSSR